MYKKLISTKLVCFQVRSFSNFKMISELPQNFNCFALPRSYVNTIYCMPSHDHLGLNENFTNFSVLKRDFSTTPCRRHEQSQMGYDEQQRKIIPKLTYLQNPWKYFIMKCNLWKLQLLWDHEFVEEEFIRGSKQAAVVLTDIIRTQNVSKVRKYTTPLGFQQITRDMLLSRHDPRLKLLKFDIEHLRHAIPAKIATQNISETRKYCFIDMLFVCLRNAKDFKTPQEVAEVEKLLRQLDVDKQAIVDKKNIPHQIVFAEILIRFRRNYSDFFGIQASANDKKGDWSVSFYNVLTFEILNNPRI